MTASPRSLAVRLGIDKIAAAKAVYRAVVSPYYAAAVMYYFARGYRYGRHIPEASIPAVAPAAVSSLEAYFDAHTEGPGIFKWRHYFDIYDRHLSRFRGQPVGIVEIGVAGGGSLQMWREYLGPDAYVYGIDIDPACKKFECEGVEILIGDQGDPAFWERFLESSPSIDIVIDDGCHLPRQQTVTLESLLPRIRAGGVYVCEDIHGPFQPFHSFVDGLTRPLNDIALAHEYNPASSLHRQVASVHHYPILTVIEKTVWCAPTFEAPRQGTEWPAGWGP